MAHGETNGRAKLTAEKVREIRRRAKAGETYKTLAAEFGVAQSNISHIISRRNWSYVE